MELTKEVYLFRKKRDESDANIMKEFAIGKTAFMNMKKRWGLIGTRSKKSSPPQADAKLQGEAEALKWKEEARRLSERVSDLTEELKSAREGNEILKQTYAQLSAQLDVEQEHNGRLKTEFRLMNEENKLLKSLLKIYL